MINADLKIPVIFQRYDGSSVRWIAPKCPTFIVDGTSMNDIKQNAVGDCWFLASLSSLATRPERIAFVINKHINETAWENEDDLVFKFFRLGKWKSYKGESNGRPGKILFSLLNCIQ